MADEKLTQQTETTDIADDDILYVVRDPATVPISRKMKFSNLVVEMGMTPLNGWIPIPSTDSWSYASATTATVPAGAESIYNKGDKIRLKQGGGYKYYSVYGTTDTVLSITGGTDFSLTTDAITDVYYSKAENPLNFPHSFNYTSTVAGTGGSAGTYAETSYVSKFRIIGNLCHTYISKVITNLGSWSGALIVLKPISATMPTLFTTMGGGCWTPTTLAPKGYLKLEDSSYFFFDKGSDNLQWADLSTGDVFTINTWSEY